MPLNRLENFIKNIEGRILYVNPNDLDSTDSISNDGNSLAQPFKTIQRALIESARFSYVTGRNNDRIERTTILVYPGEHVIDNRPGFAIKPSSGNALIATAVEPAGGETTPASSIFSLDLNSNFDLTQEDNILYKFNSVNGGVVVPRGTSLVGLDLRKTKIRPKYVPNPTDDTVPNSAIFRITGTCYFWQFSIFDGDKSGTVYTNNKNFTGNNLSTPLFSHHKLTCFEYADGINKVSGYNDTDLEMYYEKLSNAFNESAATKVIPTEDKYPSNPDGFSPQRPEFEIVGAFASDPINISAIQSGNGATPSQRITVTTATNHGLNVGTPVQIKGVKQGGGANNEDVPYNTSSIVQEIISNTQFTYLAKGDFTDVLPSSGGGLSVATATVTVETDTVQGASPYIFNCSLRSVYGINGMLADGSKATGFRSMVVAQFTGISLQKDDRAFVKYNKSNRTYDGVNITAVNGTELPSGASQTESSQIYHLDSEAIYRKGFETAHIKITNDAILQIVSVFAIGYNKHFCAESGGDASITNSNSNFGQISLSSDGFKKEAFAKDDTAYITSVITPKSIDATPKKVDWLKMNIGLTTSVGLDNHIYLDGFTNAEDIPPSLTAGYRIGAKTNEVLAIPIGNDPAGLTTVFASVRMVDGFTGTGSTVAFGNNTSFKKYSVTSGPSNNALTIGSHGLRTGEKIRIFSDDGDLPENIVENTIYFAIAEDTKTSLGSTKIELAGSKTDADNNNPVTINGGTNLSIESRVHDKEAGDIGSPIFYDTAQGNWAINVDSNAVRLSQLTPGFDDGTGTDTKITASNATSVTRIEDSRSLDDKIYKLRVVVPKELVGGKNPEESFVLQESSSTGYRNATDHNETEITASDYNYNRNLRFITLTEVSGSVVTVTTSLPHNLETNENVNIKNVKSSTNTTGEDNLGYNGTFEVTSIVNNKQFRYTTTDVDGIEHTVGTFTAGQSSTRDNNLPRFERNDGKNNFYIYRNETISPYVEGQQDGIYHIFALNASNNVPTEFTDLKYSQNVVDLYPQLDRDNPNDNPSASVSFAKRSPLGDVATNYLKNSLTRETADKLLKNFGIGLEISSVGTDTNEAELTFDRAHNFGSLVEGALPSSGMANYNNGTHYDVKILSGSNVPTGSNWNGATANVTVSNNIVTSVEIVDGGANYVAATYHFDRTSTLGQGNDTATYTVTADGIRGNIGDVVQVTGIGTAIDSYSKITAINNTTKISIAKTSGDPLPKKGQFLLHLGSPVAISGLTPLSAGITTFTTTSTHGLSKGSAFRVLDTSNGNVGDFTVKEKTSVTQFTIATTSTIPNPSLIVRHGMSANNAVSDAENENISTRGYSFYGGDVLISTELIQNSPSWNEIEVDLPGSGIGTMTRFPLGSYIQVDNEIMRVSKSTLVNNTNKITVIRGVLGSDRDEHVANSLIRKINPIPVEFRRPSILRASGHTFEYVGYGPGNYSTGLPQVQVKTLTEREEFLSQSQERGAGAVVYTGMNNRGDFFIGNKRVSSTTGQERTFDAPIPTVTGEDPSRLSVIFDEVIVKDRIVVEGGKSNKILSQFDGPVTFNENVKFNNGLIAAGEIKFLSPPKFISDDDGGSLEYEVDSLFKADIKFIDNKKILLGTGDQINSFSHYDTEIYHNQSNTIINHKGTGNLQLQDSGSTKLEVTSTGTTLSGTTAAGIINASGKITANAGAHVPVNQKITLGDSTTGVGLTFVYETGNNNGSIRHSNTFANCGLYLQSNRWVSITNENATKHGLRFNYTGNHELELFHGGTDNTARLKTTSSGIEVGTSSANGDINAFGDITAYYASDERLKDNITPIPDALDKVMSISGNTFDWNENTKKDGSETGVIAQEIEKLGLPDVVTTRDDGYMAVKYEKLVPLLIEAIKELKNEVDELKKGK